MEIRLTHSFRMSLTPFFFREKFLYLKINLHFQCSEKLSQTKFTLKLDNSWFKNNAEVCFLLGPIKLCEGPFCKNSLIAVKAPRDLRKKSDWFRCKKISQKLKYFNFKCEQRRKIFFRRFF